MKKNDKIISLIEDNIERLDSESLLLQKSIPDEIFSKLHGITKCSLNDRVKILLRMLPLRWHDFSKESSNNINFQETIKVITDLQKQIIENFTKKLVRNDFNENIISVDNVPSFYCPFWPNVANEWHRRDRFSPNKEEIQKIIKNGCHIIAKSNTISSDDYNWRWSFSIAEKNLHRYEILLRNTATFYLNVFTTDI